MDKYEYKLRLEEIKSLNRKGRFQEAAQVADGIDWKKVRNVSTLGIISDVYKVNRRFEDAKAILLLANEQSPQNRRILYSLCDLTIKMGQIVEALEYYKEFVQLSPNDNNRYILLYKIYEAQDISLDERIAVLKEYKKREYNEKWAYELAFLYHRVGLATECVEECDQLILWFGDGKYVAKAMELKMRYVPLSPAQQQAYERMFGRRPSGQQQQPPEAEEAEGAAQDEGAVVDAQEAGAHGEAQADGEMDIQVKTMDMGKYNTMNLQAALAESMREVLDPVDAKQEEYGGDNAEYLEDITRIQEASAVWDAQATGQLEEEVQEAEGADKLTEKNGMDAYLGQEYDGQISMSLEGGKPAEKQITGQMNIEDVLAEWEALKKQNEEKRRQETKRRMLQQTGSMFEDFDQHSRDGVLERLQREESLPIEEVQMRRSQQQLQPMPADGAALGTVGEAALGTGSGKVVVEGTSMEEITVEEAPMNNMPVSGGIGQQSDAEQKRLSIEALMREAEEKQREARALLMQLERERQLAAQQQVTGVQSQPGQNAQNYAGYQQYGQGMAGQVVPFAQNVPEQQQLTQRAPQPPQAAAYGQNEAKQQYRSVQGAAEPLQTNMPEQQIQSMQGMGEQPQAIQYMQNTAGTPAQGNAGQVQEGQYVQNPQAQPIQPVQNNMQEQYQSAQYAQNMPAQQMIQPAQNTSEQYQTAQPVQNMPEQYQTAQTVQNMPEQFRNAQYMQEQYQTAQPAQNAAEQVRNMQYMQNMPEQYQAAQPVQNVPEQLQNVPYVQNMPEQFRNAQYMQNMPEQCQAVQPAQSMQGQLQNAQPVQYVQNPAEQPVQNVPEVSSQEEAGAQPGTEDVGNTQELIRDRQLEEHERSMTQDEKDLFSPFVPTKTAMRQLIKALDSLSLSAYTGNMIITGAPGSDMLKLAKSVVKIMRVRDRNFSGQIAKISGDVLNTRNAAEVVAKIPNGALIIEKGSKLSGKGATDLANALNQEQTGIIVFILDNKRAMTSLMGKNPLLASCFTARFDIEALDTAMLVKYGCQYAYNMEYAIDEMGRLALHTRIEDMQTKNHAVTVEEVREIIEEAIAHAERFSVTHFTDVLFRRRYDDDDMIILKERDFI